MLEISDSEHTLVKVFYALRLAEGEEEAGIYGHSS
jgi:hypothetical protein